MKPIFSLNRSRYYEINEHKLLANLSKLIIHTLALYTFVLMVKSPFIDKQEQKPKPFVKSQYKAPKRKDHIDLHNDYLQMKIDKALELANKYVGRTGDCYRVSIQFIKELKGITDFELIKVKPNEVETGDLIYYESNGYGSTHYGVVLDYDNNKALQPNIDGKTIIRYVNEPNMAKPIFYRLERKK